MDASTIIESSMGQPARDVKVNEKIKDVLELIDKSDIKQAKERLKDLEQDMANGDPELTRMEALISFME